MAKKQTNKIQKLPSENHPAKKPASGNLNESKSHSIEELEKPANPLLFSVIVTGIFLGVVAFGMSHHEMWRDELQAWLIARDAHSIPQLFKNLEYDGHPVLWHFFLFIITRFTHNPVYMQVFHLLIAGGFIFVFNRYAEIERPYKVMFSFGYFPLYEYSVISRSYGLAILLIFMVCALYKNRSSHYILLGITLALLANVVVHAIIFSIGFAGILLLDYIFFQKNKNKDLKSLVAGLTIAVIGIVLAVYQVMPAKDNSFPVYYPNGFFDFNRWNVVFNKIFTTYFYIPKTYGINFWNTNIYFDNDFSGYSWAWVFLPTVIFIISLAIFIRKPMILMLYSGITLGLLSFYYYTGILNARYCGFLLIILMVCYWLEKYYPDKKYHNPLLIFLSKFGIVIQKPFFVIVLAANIIGAVVAYSKDYYYKFSVSKDAADYIRENKLDTLTIAGASFYIISPLAAYLDTELYYFQLNDFGSFCIYNGQIKWHISAQERNNEIVNLMNQGRTKLLVVSSYEWTFSKAGGRNHIILEHGMITKDIKIDFIKSFDAGIVSDEKYYIYLVQKVD